MFIRYAWSPVEFPMAMAQGERIVARIQVRVRLLSPSDFGMFVARHGERAPTVDSIMELITGWRDMRADFGPLLFSRVNVRRLLELAPAAGPAIARTCIRAIVSEHELRAGAPENPFAMVKATADRALEFLDQRTRP